MAKVSLRAYNREIEAMIDRSHLDEAIAHCQFILKTFPKHLETYRLLGKAYLEAKRHKEAVDIFSRVIVAVPSDFVSQVGMSIIRDEQDKLDDAIWHMERAYETQPSNAAIQAELQRLYGRRDGVQPSRIRMTRGALAHMYMQGDLYPQAISETKSVLQEDPGRTDMQALLAKAYYKSGHKNDAADTASAVLKRYPYCFDANCVLAEVLNADRPESAQIYRKRVIELDPYAAQVTGTVFQSNDVSDAAVTLEHLEWTGQPGTGMSSDWSSAAAIGLGTGALAHDAQPGWLKNALVEGFASPQSTPAFASEQQSSPSPAHPADDIPDFLRAAGWGQSTGSFDESKSSAMFEDQPTSAAQPLEQSDMPDWIKAMAPQTPAQEKEEEIPDWINKIGTDDLPVPTTPSASGDDLDWLNQPGAISDQQQSDDPPDWVKGFVQEQPISTPSDQLDWLSQPGATSDQPLVDDQPDWVKGFGQEQPISTPSDQPDWLSQPGATSDQPLVDDQPDWIKGFGQEQPAATAEAQPKWIDEFAQEEFTSTPQSDWSNQPTSTVETDSLGTSVQDQDDSFAWLENLAVKQGATEGLLTKPEERLEEEPDWIKQAKDLNELPDQAPSKPMSSANVEELGKSDAERDDSFAWLENLAAKQGATEGLLTKPEERLEEEPDWVKQARGAPPTQQAPIAEPPANVEELGKSEKEIDDGLAWFESLAAKQGATEGLLTKPEERLEQEPDWVKQARNAPPVEPPAISQPPASVEELGKSEEKSDDSFAWLENLAVKQDATQGLLTTPEERLEEEPDWVTQAKTAPPTQSIVEPEANVEQEEAQVDDVASWLRGLDDEENEEKLAVGDDDTSSWLKALDENHETPIISYESESMPSWAPDVAQEEVPMAESVVPVMEAESSSESMREAEEPVVESFAPAQEETAEDLPGWLSGLDKQKTPEVPSTDDLPAWMRDDTGELVAEPTKIEPTRSSDWHPVDEKKKEEASFVSAQDKQAPSTIFAQEKPVPSEENPEPKAQPKKKPAPRKAEAKPATLPEPTKDSAARRAATSTMSVDPILGAARTELSRSNIPGALETYDKLIKKGRFLDEVIFDLRDALYRYPVEVSIWQTLGDAYMRANRLQDALDAYTKAEELLR